jgi:excisionase family DNA binding protein
MSDGGSGGFGGLLRAEQAAERLNVPKSWILAEARADRIPHVRLGKYVRFDPAELEAWWLTRARGPRRLDRVRVGAE